jgi:FKBP-type peptidyl-prolyl cis-trans isomerase (trigger factor)
MSDTITGKITQQAAQFTVEISVPKVELKSKFKDYWDSVKDRLPAQLVKDATKGGFREIKQSRIVKAAGGPAHFYRPVLIDLISKFMNTQDRQALVYDKFDLFDGIEGSLNSTVSALAYLEPEIRWKSMPGIDSDISIDIPKLTPNLVELTVQAEIERVRDNNAIMKPVEDVTIPITDGQMAIVDFTTTIDGKIVDIGCGVNAKWYCNKESFNTPTIYDNLIGMKIGESKTFSVTYDNKTKQLAGKTGELTIRLNNILNISKPDINDDLAISHGKNNLESWRSELIKQYTEKLQHDRFEFIARAATDKLINPDVIEISPIPQIWLSGKATQIYYEQREKVKTEEDLINRFSTEKIGDRTIKTKNDLLLYFANRAAEELVHDLVLRSWGKKKGVQGDTSLDSLGKFVELTRKELVAITKLNEIEHKSE